MDEIPNSTQHELGLQDPGLTLKVKHLEERKKEGDGLKEKGSQATGDKPSFLEYALVSSEFFDEKNILTKKVLCINSPHLCDELKNVVKCYPAYQCGFQSPIEVESPFALLYHHSPELRESLETTNDEIKKEHLTLLFKYLDNEPGHAANDLMNKDLITFDLLWAIFIPGTFVRTRVYNQEWLLWLKSTAYRSHYRKGRYLALECAYSMFDGDTCGRTAKTLEIFQNSEFSGNAPTPIENLSVFPSKRLLNDDLKSKLSERGKKYKSLQNGALYHHEGFCLVIDNSMKWDPKTYPCTTVGRVVLDHKTFFEDNEYQRPTVYKWDYGDKEIDEGDVDSLYPPYVYCYSLDMRRWSELFLDNIRQVEWDNNMFNRLLLRRSPKDLLQSLVSNHSYESDARHESMLKGKGLIVVLHGSPGTGKTLTAAAVAEDTKRPLIVLPAGELGFDLSSIEDDVKRIVEYATRWKAVLLIDEADVFLEKRESGARANLKRNALVAVFLRRLEYCQGIVFLTSNRAESFDLAIKSRVHLMLHYPVVDKATRRKLWKLHLENAPGIESAVDMTKVPDILAKHSMDGREISNTVGSAVTLAKSKSSSLKQQHLEEVLRIWQESNPKWSQRYNLLHMVIISALFVLASAVITVLIASRGYQVFRNRDVLIFYR